jgi:hypothetical protein
MPLVHHDLPDFVTAETATASSCDVFYITQTGEIFPDYESYSLERVITCSCSALLYLLTDHVFSEVFVDVDPEKHYARIIELFPQKGPTNGSVPTVNGGNVEPHSIDIDLRAPQEEALARDEPMSYLYTVRLVEESEQENADGNLPR